MRTLFAFFILLSFSRGTLHAEDFSGKTSMNGLKLSDYKDFEKKWKLVTVRYRTDTAEIRFIYANDLAYKTLVKGKIDYPVGSVFAKIGFMTAEDPGFPSSIVPQASKRYQLMVKNNKKQAEADGWDYAIFDKSGLTFAENPKTQTEACVACHNAIPQRGYVFAELINLHPVKANAAPIIKAEPQVSPLVYKTLDASQLPKRIFAILPPNTKKVRVLEGMLKESLFQGTIDELRPALARESESQKLPAVIYSDDGSKFNLVFPVNVAESCTQGPKTGLMMKSIFTTVANQKNDNFLTINYCFTK